MSRNDWSFAVRLYFLVAVVLIVLPSHSDAESVDESHKTVVDMLTAGRVCACGENNKAEDCVFELKGGLKFRVLFEPAFVSSVTVERVEGNDAWVLRFLPQDGCIDVFPGRKPLPGMQGKGDAAINVRDGQVYGGMGPCRAASKREPVLPTCVQGAAAAP